MTTPPLTLDAPDPVVWPAEFHWNHGISFQRVNEDGDVLMRVGGLEFTIPSAQWCSITTAVSKRGMTAVTQAEAFTVHQACGDSVRLVCLANITACPGCAKDHTVQLQPNPGDVKGVPVGVASFGTCPETGTTVLFSLRVPA